MTVPTAGRGALAREVAAAARATPGVAGLSAGPGILAAAMYPGGTVLGVVLTTDAVTVHLRLDRLPIAAVLAEARRQITAALTSGGDPLRVDLVVEDIDDDALLPGEHRCVR